VPQTETHAQSAWSVVRSASDRPKFVHIRGAFVVSAIAYACAFRDGLKKRRALPSIVRVRL
jgi:hypothetical protein